MAKIGRLSVQIDADTGGLGTALKDAGGKINDFEGKTKSLQGTMGNLGKVSDDLKGRIAALAGVFGAAAFTGKLVETQRQFDVLNASMITMTGSAAAAEREFRWLKEFAATTPFALNDVVGAFVRMKSLGLDPSRTALESYGNTASAMGKSLNQMIEAVADASTGQFERLLEFGIKAKKEGDNVSFIFQGVTTTIRNSANEITGYLQKIGNTEFASAMKERAKTLDGAISNLADTWDELFRTINNANAGGLIYDSVKLATGAIERATKIIDAMSSSASNNSEKSGAMAATLNGITNVLEAVAVLGVNVAYVLNSTGRELGGLAAQAAAVAKLDFSGARTIGQMMKEDAVAARAEVDRLTSAILNARNASSQAAGGVGGGGGGGGGGEAGGGGGGGGGENGNAAKAGAQPDGLDEWFENYEKKQYDLQERERAYWSGRVTLIQESFLTESELLEKKYQEDLARLDAATMSEDQRRITRELLQVEHLDRMSEIEKEDHDRRVKAEAEAAAQIENIRKSSMTNIERFTAMSWQDQAKTVASAMSSELSSVTTNSRAMFNIQKAANIASAIMTTYSGANRALNDYPAPWSYAVAATTVAAGLARVASIKAQTFGGAAASAGGVSAAGGVAATSGMAQQSGGGGGGGFSQTIAIQGMSSGDIFSGDAVRTLIDRLIDAQRNGARIVLA